MKNYFSFPMKIIPLLFLSLVFAMFGDEQGNNYPEPPKTKELLFFIQRNHNSNTIIYDANFDDHGQLRSKDPIDVYWIRYQEEGQRMELRTIEKMFAYGVDCAQIDGYQNKYSVQLVAHRKRNFQLIQNSPFDAFVSATIDNKISRLKSMYIQADNSGFWPKVIYIELFGKDLETGAETYEKVLN